MTWPNIVRQRTDTYFFDPRHAMWALTRNAGGPPPGPGQQDASGARPERLVDAAIVGLRIDSSRLRQVQDALRGIIDTPARLTIVQSESMVIVTASNGYTMRLSPGTRGIKDESNGIEMKTRWDQNVLVTEISGIAHDKIIETYSVDVAHRLHVVVKLPLKRRTQIPELHRIYEAVPS